MSDAYSVERLIWHGQAMLAAGWKVKPDLCRGFGYLWESPRSGFFPSDSHNMPSRYAIENAQRYKDYPVVDLLPPEPSPRLPNAQSVSEKSVQVLRTQLQYASLMRQAGWTTKIVEQVGSIWTSPRGDSFDSVYEKLPSANAIMDAIGSNDVKPLE